MSSTTNIIPTKLFSNLFNEKSQITLMGKTKRFTTVSDWHDLMILAMNINKYTLNWLKTVIDTFYHHAANREAFTLLDPRPAIWEANIQHRNNIKIMYHFVLCIMYHFKFYTLYLDY